MLPLKMSIKVFIHFASPFDCICHSHSCQSFVIMASLSEQAKLIADGLLPEKSKDKYIQVYNSFIKWKEENQIDKNDFSEDVLLVYFGYLRSK